MKNSIKTKASILGLSLMAASALPASAAEQSDWKFEFTPYLWAASMKADVEVRGHSGSVDASFNDLMDKMDASAAFLGTAQYKSWVTWVQFDYINLNFDLEGKRRTGALDVKQTMGTFGLGYQFPGWKEGQTFDVLLGVRTMTLENELSIDSVGTFSKDSDFVDPVIIVRPSFQISEKWRFNPTLSYGTGGDSEETWELQPQFQYQAWENAAFRFGYRKLHYKIENEQGNSFDGSFEGPIIGVGITF